MSISDPESRSSTPGPDPLPHVPSKMDKYFAESYDPPTGLINDEEFYGWDSMLELIRQRNEDREERKRLERLGIAVPKSSSKIPKNKKSLGGSAAMDERWDAGNSSIMEIEYKKKGAVREWDMGKEGF
ncbi:hypothetical protein ONZ45_g11437 [Pleurotus djamor]|nr:hypothetical protein ONZ45_g11437 [Pleurotus djamor]